MFHELSYVLARKFNETDTCIKGKDVIQKEIARDHAQRAGTLRELDELLSEGGVIIFSCKVESSKCIEAYFLVRRGHP